MLAVLAVLLAWGGGGGGTGGWVGGAGGRGVGMVSAWGVGHCRISEFPCASGKCIRPDAFCDGRDNCGDGSDEPPYCTGFIRPDPTDFFFSQTNEYVLPEERELLDWVKGRVRIPWDEKGVQGDLRVTLVVDFVFLGGLRSRFLALQ
ncbi:hypothetical protein J437_LFUL009808 [Ladona fulva]|uniref:Uncharacterized protein n=1 Tax=Ladona fulva TaxID=123851 RepID=A0A8K0K3D4_LADFU|nr:hypothetical protein J437_LFUL009808 [Ladona fulva]